MYRLESRARTLIPGCVLQAGALPATLIGSESVGNNPVGPSATQPRNRLSLMART